MCALAIGIDLGTTNSCVGVYKDGKVQIIQNDDHYILPSWVSFTDDSILTGHEAKDGAHLNLQNTIFEAKRLIGQSCGDEKIEKYIKNLPYKVVNDNGFLKIEVVYKGETKLYFPEEISAYVLEKLKDIAQSYLGHNITKAVVTVPAYYNDVQREATKIAATIAGFRKENVLIINEPTAAALAFNHQNPKRYKRNVLVYDFGGGTFDVSIVTVGRGECIVKATKGDLHLGGTDIDANLVNYIKENFKEQFKEEISNDDEVTRRLKNTCEKVKIALSGVIRTREIDLPNLSGQDYFALITRQQFEELNQDIFQQTIRIVEDCIGKSGLTKDNIDEVILVGGSSKIPKVQEILIEYFGEDKINKGVNPDEAVAYGAAIHATCLVGNKSEVKDVISLSLGIAAWGYLKSDIIACNTPIPAKFTKTYSTVFDNQETVDIMVFQGENLLVKNNTKLGKFTLTGLRKVPAKELQIDVCFEVDSEGIVSVTASEKGVENRKSIQIDVTKMGLTSEESQQRVAEFELDRQNNFRIREFLNEKHRLEGFCRRISEKASNLTDTDVRAEVFLKCNSISEWLENLSIDDQNEIEEQQQELEGFCLSFSLSINDESEK